MRLKSLEITGFKSFAKKTSFLFDAPITAIVGPNGSGKSNTAEAFRWVLGEKSMKSLRGKRGEDLIFNGGNNATKLNRAAVTLIFDNQDKSFDLDFEEVAITREVHRDGTNVYLLNGSQVRYKDIFEALSRVSLGASDRYIINQGEADRILSAPARERRVMIEDALGLRLYQWKIEESEKKLEKVSENMEQVSSLRREIAPHIKFLKKQVEKIEQASALRRELKALYLEYFKREDTYLTSAKHELAAAKRAPEAELARVQGELKRLHGLEHGAEGEAERQELARVDTELRRLTLARDELGRQIGRLEGMIEVKSAGVLDDSEPAPVAPANEVREVARLVVEELDRARDVHDVGMLQAVLAKVRELTARLVRTTHTGDGREPDEVLARLRREHSAKQAELAALEADLERAGARRVEVAAGLEAALQAVRQAERGAYELRARQTELESQLATLAARGDKLALEEENFKRELSEARALVDHEVVDYQHVSLNADAEDRSKQEERRRRIERYKIRLEDMGAEGGDTLKEYREATERDEYLARELNDLTASAGSLTQVVADLKQKIENDFATGIQQINEHFQNFFLLMFGGGTASVIVTREKVRADADVEIEEDVLGSGEPPEQQAGLEIKVSLPRKKTHGLAMLSGGERALVSIALLFAMSQVNPPPFLILDETDAALDEANSKKYGDMVENLAKHSQLVLITHNRETMSRAGVIYGVTMGGDGVSKLLSIKFDEATTFAK